MNLYTSHDGAHHPVMHCMATFLTGRCSGCLVTAVLLMLPYSAAVGQHDADHRSKTCPPVCCAATNHLAGGVICNKLSISIVFGFLVHLHHQVLLQCSLSPVPTPRWPQMFPALTLGLPSGYDQGSALQPPHARPALMIDI